MARSTAWRASTFFSQSSAASAALGGSFLPWSSTSPSRPSFSAASMRPTTASVLASCGIVSGLAHAHDRAGAGHQTVEHGGVGGLGFRIDGGVGDAAEILGERRQRRRAFQAVALQRREIERRAGDLAHGVELGGVAVAAIHGALEVGDLQREQHARGIAGALALALEEALADPARRR